MGVILLRHTHGLLEYGVQQATLDLDHDGQLTPEELIKGYTAMIGEEEAKKEVDRIFKAIDVNRTGAIDFTGNDC